MKYLFTTLILIILHSVCLPVVGISANDNQLITEIRVIDNDSSFRYLYLYDDLGNKVLETKYYQQDSIWIRKTMNEWIYTGTNCTAQRERSWNDNQWMMTYTIDYEFVNDQLNTETHNTYTNSLANLLKKVDYQYDNARLTSKKEYARELNAWTLNLENDFRYLADGKTDSIITTNYTSGNIVTKLLSTFVYQADGSLQSQILQEKSDTGWNNTEKINWLYDPNSAMLASVRNKKWMSTTSSWENTQRIDYEYINGDELASETYQRWKTMFWENDIRYDYQYDNAKRLLKKTLSKPIYTDWRGLISINYSNFTNQKANDIDSKYEFWGGTTDQLTTSYIPFVFNNEQAVQKGRSIEISYVPLNDTALFTPVENNGYHLIPVYPNPSVGIFYVNTQKYALKSWTVSNINGQVLKQEVQTFQSGVIDLTDLPKGVYILKATTDTEQLIQKLIKE